MTDGSTNKPDQLCEATEIDKRTVSRRDFLKMTAALGAAISLTGGVGSALVACGSETTTTTGSAETTATTSVPTTDSAPAPVTTGGSTPTSVSAINGFDAKVDQLWEQLSTIVSYEVNDEIKAGPKAVTGKKILYLPIALSGIDTFKQADEEHKKACDVLGWSYSSIDTVGDPNKLGNALEQAITMKCDGVITHLIDPSKVRAPLQALKDAKIPVTALASPDPEELFACDQSPKTFNLDCGYRNAAAAYRLTRDAQLPLKIINVTDPGNPLQLDRIKGLDNFLAEALAAGVQGAEVIYTSEHSADEITTTFPGKAVSAVRSHPDYTVMIYGGGGDAIAARGGLAAAGIYDKTKIWCLIDAQPANIEDLRDGGAVKSILGAPIVWTSWNDIDDLNRIFNGAEPLGGDKRGNPQTLITADNVEKIVELTGGNVAYWDSWSSDPLKASYMKIWGLA